MLEILRIKVRNPNLEDQIPDRANHYNHLSLILKWSNYKIEWLTDVRLKTRLRVEIGLDGYCQTFTLRWYQLFHP